MFDDSFEKEIAETTAFYKKALKDKNLPASVSHRMNLWIKAFCEDDSEASIELSKLIGLYEKKE